MIWDHEAELVLPEVVWGVQEDSREEQGQSEACTNAAPGIDPKERFWNFTLSKKAKPSPHLQKGVRTVKNFIRV